MGSTVCGDEVLCNRGYPLWGIMRKGARVVSYLQENDYNDGTKACSLPRERSEARTEHVQNVKVAALMIWKTSELEG